MKEKNERTKQMIKERDERAQRIKVQRVLNIREKAEAIKVAQKLLKPIPPTGAVTTQRN